ncbi:MAG: DNA repair protein RecN [Gammaproteobacteria bacterium]|nr:DNA repair protein RecN [Gammaproteobacteria bacterium]
MLESIQIKNFAIIEALQLEFDHGMTALTGETGAGKSILLDAIKLISGERADSDSIKSDEDKSEISVCFDIGELPGVRDWLKNHELVSDDECIIRRVLYSNGRSKAFINGYSAPLSQLRELTQMLVDIHGQHEHQSLQKTRVQRTLLDTYLADEPLLDLVNQRFHHWRQLKQQYDDIRNGSQEREQRIDLLKIYCAELNQLNLAEGENAQLQEKYKRLSNAGQLLETATQVLGLLYDNEESTIQSQLSHCQQMLSRQTHIDPRLGGSEELINGALIQIQEASNELRSYQDSVDIDESQLNQLNQRIASIQELSRKHHVRPDDLPQLTTSLNNELEQLQGSAMDLGQISRDIEQARDDYLFSARELSVKRQQTATLLSEQISTVMQQLGMQGGQFLIQLETDDSVSNFKQHGIDQVSYTVSANPGQALKPLNKVASGGELSRISLAIQVILSQSSAIPTLIFDEVDSGVGGGIAEIVGNRLRELGSSRQVFCVTHLAQVASQAHHHYRVDKNKSSNATTTHVVALSEQQRVEEIARMLGGVTITAQTRAHASEMITASGQA